MSKHLRDTLIPKGRTIYFDEEHHKYTNELGFTYTSTTTVVGKYTDDFKSMKIAKACERIGHNPNHPKYLNYKGKTASQLVREWKQTTKEACEFGTKKHNFLEESVKQATGYKTNARGYIEGKIYTLDDVMINHNYGRLKIIEFAKTGVQNKYPKIFDILKGLSKAGYFIYAEIGVYDDLYGVSGLIDILCINHTTGDFIIVDWKTNKAPIHFDSGYYAKTIDGRLDLDKWISKDEHFAYPLNHLADSVGNHYAMQLSTYAYLVTTFGYTFKGLVLCHIRPIEEQFAVRENWKEVVEVFNLQYLENDSKLMLDDFRMKNTEQQGQLQFN